MEPHEVDYYKRLAREHRGTPAQIGAGSETSQQARFRVIVDLLDDMLGGRWPSLTLLDFGCGKGDLAPYLARHGAPDLSRTYIGLDAIEENVADARRLGPWDFRLGLWDGQGRIVAEDVDLIVFSGALSTTRLDRRAHMFRRMLDLARVGVVGNFLTRNARVQKPYSPESVLMDPEQCLALIDRAVFRVQLRLDYLPQCFTVGAIRWDAAEPRDERPDAPPPQTT